MVGLQGIFDFLRKMWMEHGIALRLSVPIRSTGYEKGTMIFKRPVPDDIPISAFYGEWGPLWSYHMQTCGSWVNGQVNGKGQHKGIDFACPVGTEVYAMYDGLIVRAGFENPNEPKQGFGLRARQQIVTESGVCMTLVYGHMSVLHVHEGQQVAKGDRIGFSGKTGHVSGPHLHIELVDGRGQYHPVNFESPLENQRNLA